jgi:hypothetical protein
MSLRLKNQQILNQRANIRLNELSIAAARKDIFAIDAFLRSRNGDRLFTELGQKYPDLIPLIDRAVRSRQYATDFQNRTDRAYNLQGRSAAYLEAHPKTPELANHHLHVRNVDTLYRKLQYELHLKSQHALEHERMALQNYQKFVQNPPTFHETQTYSGQIKSSMPYMEAEDGPPQPDINRMMHAGTYLKKIIHRKAQDPHNRYGKAVLMRHHNNLQQQMHQEDMKKKRNAPEEEDQSKKRKRE